MASLSEQEELNRRGIKFVENKPLPKKKKPTVEEKLTSNIEENSYPQRPKPKDPEPTQEDEELGPHDSAELYSQIVNRHTEKVFPTLTKQDKGTAQWIIVGLLVGLVVLGAWGTAYEAEIAITPHVAGHCSAPAVIQNGGCYRVSTSIGSNGQTITTLTPAGTIGP